MSLLADSQDESAALAVDNQHQQFKSESNLGNDASTINSSTENDEDQATVELVKDEDEERDSQESSLKDSQSSALPAASVMNDQMTSDRRDGSVPMPYPLIHTSPIIPVVFPAMRAIKLKDQLRKGKWTPEEEKYSNKVIEVFNAGLLKLPENDRGITLRSYLAEKLSCDPMRITKKYAGAACLGKRVYHFDYINANQDAAERARQELHELEVSFRSKLEQLARRRGMEPTSIHQSHRIVSTPAIDALMQRNRIPGYVPALVGDSKEQMPPMSTYQHPYFYPPIPAPQGYVPHPSMPPPLHPSYYASIPSHPKAPAEAGSSSCQTNLDKQLPRASPGYDAFPPHPSMFPQPFHPYQFYVPPMYPPGAMPGYELSPSTPFPMFSRGVMPQGMHPMQLPPSSVFVRPDYPGFPFLPSHGSVPPMGMQGDASEKSTTHGSSRQSQGSNDLSDDSHSMKRPKVDISLNAQDVTVVVPQDPAEP